MSINIYKIIKAYSVHIIGMFGRRNYAQNNENYNGLFLENKETIITVSAS
jgi:hypothetical protein